jgi:hypothetical protein
MAINNHHRRQYKQQLAAPKAAELLSSGRVLPVNTESLTGQFDLNKKLLWKQVSKQEGTIKMTDYDDIERDENRRWQIEFLERDIESLRA